MLKSDRTAFITQSIARSNSVSMAANGHANAENVNGRHEMADDTFLFTSESVNEGHPDKLCDQVWSAHMLIASNNNDLLVCRVGVLM